MLALASGNAANRLFQGIAIAFGADRATARELGTIIGMGVSAGLVWLDPVGAVCGVTSGTCKLAGVKYVSEVVEFGSDADEIVQYLTQHALTR